MARLGGNVSDGVTLTSLDKVAEADLNCMVTERSDSQFVGLVNSWTGQFVCGFVKSRNAVLKSHYINYLTPIFHYIVSEYFPIPYLGSGAVEFAD